MVGATLTNEQKLTGSISGVGTLGGNMATVLAKDGDSAYQIALKKGFEGTEEEWLASLKGEKGDAAVSPDVSVSAINGGHKVTITDADSTHSFDVFDGSLVIEAASGSTIAINDSSDRHLMNFKLFGKTTQAGAATPATPYPLVSIVNPTVTLTGNATQQLNIARTFSGIPVTSGGNYTDENGQKWICDEIDFKRGVYIKRTVTKTFTDFSKAMSHTYDGKGTSAAMASNETLVPYIGVSTHFKVSNAATAISRFNVLDKSIYFKLEGELTAAEWNARMTELAPTVICALATPVETAVTDEEIAAYQALQTNYLNTTIENDQGAWMETQYVADMASFIRNNCGSGGGSGGPAARIGEATLLAANWQGSASPYSQVVNIAGVTKYSQVDLTPSVEQLSIFYNKDLAFVTENENGVVTVYAIGQKPKDNYTIQVTITEVSI